MTDQQIDPNSNSLVPVETDASLNEAVDSMDKGSGLKLVGFAVGLAAVIAVAVAVLGNLDNRQAFVDAGARVAALKEDRFEAFLNCALVNMNQSQIKSADDLEFQLDKRAQHFGKPYAATLQKCAANLDTLERELATLAVPDPLKQQTKAMEKAAGEMRHALQNFVATSASGGPQYDAAASKPALSTLAKSWQRFAQSHTAFTDALRKHL